MSWRSKSTPEPGPGGLRLADRYYFALTTHALGWVTRAHLLAHRLTGGRALRRAGGMPTLLLTTTGRASGRPRTVPLSYFVEAGCPVVIASNAGGPRFPAWYLNLRADPHAVVELRGARRPVVADFPDPAEQARLWPRVLQLSGLYGAYRGRTARPFPLVILRPVRPA
jgi:deazaflavin-dependent oxidoreductase (nitroreductase family)